MFWGWGVKMQLGLKQPKSFCTSNCSCWGENYYFNFPISFDLIDFKTTASSLFTVIFNFHFYRSPRKQLTPTLQCHWPMICRKSQTLPMMTSWLVATYTLLSTFFRHWVRRRQKMSQWIRKKLKRLWKWVLTKLQNRVLERLSMSV